MVVLKDKCIPMPMGVGNNNKLKDIVSVVEPRDMFLAYVAFCSPRHGDSFRNRDNSTSIAVVSISYVRRGLRPLSGTVVGQTDFNVTIGQCAVSYRNLAYAILIRHKTNRW